MGIYGTLSHGDMFDETFINGVTCPPQSTGTVNILCRDNQIIITENMCTPGKLITI